MPRKEKQGESVPQTVAEEVLDEFEDAQLDDGDPHPVGRRGGEGDALTTNEEAQEATARKGSGKEEADS